MFVYGSKSLNTTIYTRVVRVPNYPAFLKYSAFKFWSIFKSILIVWHTLNPNNNLKITVGLCLEQKKIQAVCCKLNINSHGVVFVRVDAIEG